MSKAKVVENNKVKKNRVIGARGIGVTNSNLNAAFDGGPKVLADGTFTNSDVSTKYLDRDYWKMRGENVLIKKRIKREGVDNVSAYALEDVLKEELEGSNCKIADIINNYVDIQNYGAAIAVKGLNFSITGVVQYNQGVNKLEDSNVIVQDILAPFKNTGKSKDSDKEDSAGSAATSIGKHTYVDKALYVQSFNVNPSNLNNYTDILKEEGFVGYKEDSYDKFKEAVLHSATLLTSRSKSGCYDSFSIFVSLKEGSIFSLGDLGRYINVTSTDKKNIIDFNDLSFLNEIKDVEKIEIYYNHLECELEHSFENVEIKRLVDCY